MNRGILCFDLKPKLAVVALILFTAAFFLIVAAAKADPPANENSPATERITPPSNRQPTVDPVFASPRATLTTFFEAMNTNSNGRSEPDWDRALACMNTSLVDFSSTGKRDEEKQLCKSLLGSLNRIKLFEMENVPGREQVRQNQQDKYVIFPHFDQRPEVLARQKDIQSRLKDELMLTMTRETDGRWVFSAETIQHINTFYAQIKGLPKMAGQDETLLTAADHVRAFIIQTFGQNMTKHAFILENWQWVALLLLILLGIVTDFLVRAIAKVIHAKLRARFNLPKADETTQKVMRPFGLTAAALIWVLAIPYLGLPDLPERVLTVAARFFAVLSAVWAAWRLTDLVADAAERKATATATRIDDIIVPLLRKTIKVFIIAVGAIVVADSLNFDVWPMVAGLGVGGVAFAFAAKDTIENLFGSVAVILDRPFDVGDWIVIDGTEGIVEQVGFRSTRVRTFYNSQVTVPNANLVRASVDNYGRRRYRRWSTHVGVQYDTSPDNLIAFAEGIRELIRVHPYTRKDYFQVRVHEFAGSSINILLYVFWEVPDWSTELRERERLMVDIVRLADKLGVSFAFPTQTVHLFKGAKAEAAKYEPPQSMTDRRAQVTGIWAVQELTKDQPWKDEKPGPVVYEGGPSYIEIDPETGRPVDETFVEDRSAGGE